MADQPTAPVAATKPDATAPDNDRDKIIAAYLEAPTRADKGALVAKHPWLGRIFSAINHS